MSWTDFSSTHLRSAVVMRLRPLRKLLKKRPGLPHWAAKGYHVKLYGILDDLSVAKTHQAKDVVEWRGDAPKGTKGYFKVAKVCEEVVMVSTPLGNYELQFNSSSGIFQGAANGTKIHVSLKKISGKLIFWA